MRRALAAGATVAFLAAGCGLGGGGDDFGAEAEAICEEYDERIAEVSIPTSLDELVESSGEIADILEERLAELRALEPPEDRAEAYADWQRLNEESIANAREIQEAAGEDDELRIADLAGVAEQNEREADRVADELGLEECLIEEDGSQD